jgi:hypothetical protein
MNGTKQNVAEGIARNAKISVGEAMRYIDILIRRKVASFDAVNGGFKVKHGAFLDRETVIDVLARN